MIPFIILVMLVVYLGIQYSLWVLFMALDKRLDHIEALLKEKEDK